MLLTFVSSEMVEDDGMDANDENVENGCFHLVRCVISAGKWKPPKMKIGVDTVAQSLSSLPSSLDLKFVTMSGVFSDKIPFLGNEEERTLKRGHC